jgi:hypothetical protein
MMGVLSVFFTGLSSRVYGTGMMFLSSLLYPSLALPFSS